GAHVRSKALVIAYAVHESGVREVIGLDLGEVESEAFWVEFLRSLRARGLRGVRLAVSDQHEGLGHAIERVLACPWQRCTVHFVRNMHQHCRPSQRGLVAASVIHLAGALLIEQNDEWLVCRRYLSIESMALLDAVQDEDDHNHKEKGEEVVALNAA